MMPRSITSVFLSTSFIAFALLGASLIMSCTVTGPVPELLRQPRIVVAGDVHVQSVASVAFGLSISEIFVADATAGPTPLFVHTGESIQRFDVGTGELLDSLTLPEECWGTSFVDLDGDDTPELATLGYLLGPFAAVCDSAGKLVWSKPTDPVGGPLLFWLAAGQLDDAPGMEFCITSAAGLSCVDANGETIWRAGSSNYYRNVQIIASQTGLPMVVSEVEVSVRGRRETLLEFRDHRGELVSQRDLHGSFPTHPALDWPPMSQEQTFPSLPGTKIFLQRIDDTTVQVLDIPSGFERLIKRLEAAPIMVDTLDPRNSALAIILGHPNKWGRMSLLIYAPDWSLIYHEVLPESYGMLVANIPAINDRGETLLIGSDNQVLAYMVRVGLE